MKSKERIELTGWEKIWYYDTSILFLIGASIFGFFFFQSYRTQPQNFGLLYLPFIFLIVSIIFFFIGKNRLYFEEYKGQLSDKDFKKAVKITAKELRWEIIDLTNNYAKAFRYAEPLGGSDERIIIKKTSDKVYINSLQNFEISQGLYNRKRNRENINIFAYNAAQILRGEYVEKTIRERKHKKEEKFWNENEWSFGNIMMRVVGYGLFLLFLAIGLLFLTEGSIEGVFPVLISLAIGFTYIRADIKVLKEKRKRKQNK